MPANLENSAVAPQYWKRSVFIPVSKKSNAKECSNYCTIVLISHASKIMLKILQARLQQYMNSELSDVQARFKRQRNQRSNCQHPLDHRKIKRVSEKASTSALLTLPKPLTLWNTTNFGKFWKNGNTRPLDLPPEKPIYRSISNSSNWTWNNRLVPNQKRSMPMLYIVTLLI